MKASSALHYFVGNSVQKKMGVNMVLLHFTDLMNGDAPRQWQFSALSYYNMCVMNFYMQYETSAYGPSTAWLQYWRFNVNVDRVL